MTRAGQKTENRKLVGRLVVLAIGMFGFGFLLWPLYDVFCEITGLNGRASGLVQASSIQTQADSQRLVTVQFDANVNRGLAWNFKPVAQQMQVRPGELASAIYLAKNRGSEAVIGQAVPSVAPGRAAAYFNKTECFCFTQQLLEAGEEREMPVHFIINPDLPEDVRTITLSYTFFRSEAPTPGGS